MSEGIPSSRKTEAMLELLERRRDGEERVVERVGNGEGQRASEHWGEGVRWRDRERALGRGHERVWGRGPREDSLVQVDARVLELGVEEEGVPAPAHEGMGVQAGADHLGPEEVCHRHALRSGGVSPTELHALRRS